MPPTPRLSLFFFFGVFFLYFDLHLHVDENPYDILENVAVHIYSFVENNTFVRNCANIEKGFFVRS